MEDSSSAAAPDKEQQKKVDYRRRSRKNEKRTAVQGLCLFCFDKFPRSRPYPLTDMALSNVPKYRRSFNFLAAELGVQLPSQTEFSFISEQVPLCLDCLNLLEQVNVLFLKLQSVKFQLGKIVGTIRASVIKSRSNSTNPPIYTEVELLNESHFNAFRRQVVEEEEEDGPSRHSCDLKISLPSIKLMRLDPAEVERQTQRKIPPPEDEESDEDVDNVNELNFNNLIEEEEEEDSDSHHHHHDFDDFIIENDETHDVKPDISELNQHQGSTRRKEERRVEEELKSINNIDDIAIEMIPQLEVEVPFESVIIPNCNNESMPQLCLVSSNEGEIPILHVNSDVATHDGASVIPPELQENNLKTSTTDPPRRKKRQRTIYPKDVDEDACKLCNILFKTQKQLADHYKSNHPAEFPRHCPEPGCDYGALLPNAIRKHIFMKHAPPEVREVKKNMICTECGKRFFASKNLKHHILMHKNLRPFSCSVGQCDKKFRCQQALDVHIFRIHENVRNFPCPHCDFRFKDHVSLKGHIAIHTGEKKFFCHICGENRRFIQHHALKSHWNVHKKKGDWTEPPGYNKPRGGWVRKSRKGLNQIDQPPHQPEDESNEQSSLGS